MKVLEGYILGGLYVYFQTRNRISRRAKEHEDQKAEETPICTKTNLFLYVHMIISAIIHQICDLITFMFSVRLIGS